MTSRKLANFIQPANLFRAYYEAIYALSTLQIPSKAYNLVQMRQTMATDYQIHWNSALQRWFRFSWLRLRKLCDGFPQGIHPDNLL